ncbi:CRISPR-associated Cse5e family protein [Klebsiella pneumoniae]|uniref:CRISPR-associated Cse5e family protein n=1 Tax=Klebsiella pneumoniae TaxID=573 RepID=A0A377TUD6_KLEPN|nr:CRISPR-associated Cse5e family protein [Klebsiella pneumoniae]
MGDVITLNDVPVQFGRHKRYRDRQVTVLGVRLMAQGRGCLSKLPANSCLR